MSPRTGRPKKETTMDSRFQFRVDAEFMKKLDFCVEKTGKSRSEIVREGVDTVFLRLKEKG